VLEIPVIRPDSWNFFGFQINEQLLKGVDAILIMCFCYMVVYEISDYKRYKEEAECIKPFGLFWIGHFMSIVCCRIFYHLQKYFHCRMAQEFFDQDSTILRQVHFWAVAMRCLRLLSYCGFLTFTVIGGVWFVEDGRCLNKLDATSNSHSWVKMAFWLFLSFSVCLVYMIRILKKQFFWSARPDLPQGDDNERFRMFVLAEQLRDEGGRSLSPRELDAIKRSQLLSHNELSRTASRSISTEMSTVTSSKLIPVSNEDRLPPTIEVKQEEVCHAQGTCAVCLEEIEIGQWYKKLPKCEHCFHAPCIDEWLSTRATCPVCREEIIITGRWNGDDQPVRSVRREIRIGSVRDGGQTHVVLQFTRVGSS